MDAARSSDAARSDRRLARRSMCLQTLDPERV